MNPFDEMTLAEVDEMTEVCFNGKSLEETNPFNVAGGVLYMTRKRDNPELNWKEFRENTRMHEINEFARLLNDEEPANPTGGVTN